MSTTSTQLGLLENAGLIRLLAAHPELEYIFRHTLVREAAYGSLLHRQRRLLHRAAGEALEAGLAGEAQRAELAPLLALHFDEAGDEARALHYLTLAGEAAAAQYALPEAIGLLTRALEIARRPAATDGLTLTGLYLARGRALRSAMRWDETDENYAWMETDAATHADEAMRLACLIEQATLLAVFSPLFNIQQSLDLSTQALTLAERLHDRAAQARILWNLMRADAYQDTPRAIDLGEQSVALSRELNLREQLAYSLHDLNYAYRGDGQPREALARLVEALAMWRALGQRAMLADNLNQCASLWFFQGEFEQAQLAAVEAGQIGAQIASPEQRTVSLIFMALHHCERGDCGRALEYLAATERLDLPEFILSVVANARSVVWSSLGAYEFARAEFSASVAPLRVVPIWSLLGHDMLGQQALVLIALGDQPGAGSLLEEAVELARQQSRVAVLNSGGSSHIFLAEIIFALARGRLDEALDLAHEYLTVLRAQTLRGLLPDALLVYAAALEAAGQPGAAIEALSEARAIAQAIGQRRTLWQVLARLAEYAAQQDQPQAAAELRAEAAGHAAFIAEHAGAPELRQSFLSLPLVQAVLHSP